MVPWNIPGNNVALEFRIANLSENLNFCDKIIQATAQNEAKIYQIAYPAVPPITTKT